MRGILPGFTFAMLFVALAATAEAGTLRTDFAKHLVPLEDIIPGGPPPDGIPAIDHPVFVAAAEADAWLKPPEPVLALDVNGDARAYPLRILIWQEIVNERLGRIQGRIGPPLDVPLASALSPAWRAGVPTPESGTMLAEWEKAARGDDGRIFLWGNHWDPERLNSAARGPGGTTPVNQYSGGVSPYGVFDPVGNVFQWTSSAFADGRTILKGCSWDDDLGFAGRRFGMAVPPRAVTSSSGFGARVQTLPGASGTRATADSESRAALRASESLNPVFPRKGDGRWRRR